MVEAKAGHNKITTDGQTDRQTDRQTNKERRKKSQRSRSISWKTGIKIVIADSRAINRFFGHASSSLLCEHRSIPIPGLCSGSQPLQSSKFVDLLNHGPQSTQPEDQDGRGQEDGQGEVVLPEGGRPTKGQDRQNEGRWKMRARNQENDRGM